MVSFVLNKSNHIEIFALLKNKLQARRRDVRQSPINNVNDDDEESRTKSSETTKMTIPKSKDNLEKEEDKFRQLQTRN